MGERLWLGERGEEQGEENVDSRRDFNMQVDGEKIYKVKVESCV